MWIRKKTLANQIDKLEEELYLNYKKLNLTVLDARRQHHVFNVLRSSLHLDS
jgi:hypothetical protein